MKKSLILFFTLISVLINAQNTIVSNSFDNSSDWIIGAPNLQGQWQVDTTTPADVIQYVGAMASTSASNGFGVFDAIQILISGSVSDQDATLELKDTFDLTNYSAVSLEFEQRYRKFNYDETFIEFSTDNGSTWPTSLAIQLNTLVNTNDPAVQELVAINISSYVGGQSGVKVRFRWLSISSGSSDQNAYGSGYGWMVDDLKITVPPVNDVQNLSSWIFGELSSGAEYGRTPISQVEQNYYVGASVYNFGSATQNNVIVDGAFNGPTNFTTTASIVSIPSDSTTRIESLEPMNFAVGVYNGVITATSPGDTTGSGNFGDNLYLRNFEITNDVYSLDGIGNNPAGNELLGSIGTASFTGAEDGLICATMYPFYANDTINSVKVLINGSESSAGAEIILRIIDSTSFRNQLFNNAIYSSVVYTVTANDIAQEFIEIPVGNVSSNGLLFESFPIPAGNYYIAIEMFSFTNLYDIAIINDLTVVQPAWSSAIFIPNDQNYTNGNAFAIRLNLGDNTAPTTPPPTGQCVPDNSYLGNPFGIYSTVNDTFYLNVPSSKSYTITTSTDGGFYDPNFSGYVIDSVKLVSVRNLPAGLNYSTNNSNLSLGGVDCININGVYNNSINSSYSVEFKFLGCVSLFGLAICDTFTTSKLFHFYDGQNPPSPPPTGQTRYFDEVFDSVTVTRDIQYATNMSVVLSAVGLGPTLPTGGHPLAPPLAFDFYEPYGDLLTERPLLVYLHTGTFAPRFLNNNPTGDRNDYATVKMCERFAKRGYAVANLEYRLGWNGGAGGSLAANSISWTKAIYRAIQDTKAAVRYFYRDVKDFSNTYKIDTNKIALVGQGSGGWVALGYATIDKLSELQLPKFLSFVGVPLLDTAVLGDWDGYGGNPSQNIVNNPGYSSKIQMVCSMGGGMDDLSWLEAGEVPIAAVHSHTDGVAIYTTGDVNVTTAQGLIPITTQISGSYDVITKANMLGNNASISGINDVYTTAAQNASNSLVGTLDKGSTVIGQPVDNLFPFVTANANESAPWEFWDSATTVAGAAAFGKDGQQILAGAAIGNPDMSMAKATAYMDSTLGFFCPRIVKAFAITNCRTTSSISNLYCGNYLYNGQTYFTPNIFYDTLTNANGCDSILTIGFEEIVSYGIDTIVSCSSYTWIDGNTYTSSNNFASYTVQNAAGCDSIVTLNLTINPNQFNTDFTVNQTLFTAPPFAAQFANTTPNPSNYNFTWDFSDGTILQSNNASVFHQFLNNGLYDVTLIAENILTGCTDTMFKDDFIFCAGGTSCTHASTINQTGPITACLSDSIFLTCNTDPTFSYQWRLNGTYIPGAVDAIYYPSQSGNYSVLISQNGCPEVSSDISVNVSPTPNPPFITSSGSFVPCQASFVTLSVPNNFATYSWSSGGTSSTEVITSSGSYFVTVTNIGGCASKSLPFNVNASFVQPPDVCIVGVNPQTNFNRVVWEHPNSTAIDSFYVYKETNQANIYQKIGGTAFNDTAIFDDVSSNPAVQAYRYKLSSVDSCGVESDLGDFHKTIHLTINQGIGAAWNLIWSGYEGFSYPSYNIYRGLSANNMVLLTTIASNLNSYTDLTAPGGQLYYQIEVVSNYTCDPSRSFNSSRSNIVDNGAVVCNNMGIDIISACDSLTWIDGVTYTASNNTATYTLTNAAGCDSVVTLNLTINQTSSSIDNQILCDGNTLNWIDGNTYTSSNNTATYTLTNSDGCDSIVSLNLTVSSSTSTLLTISSCNSYTFNNQTLTSSGIYIDTNVNAAGCPQIDSLDLTITSLGTTTVQSSCDSFLWNGTTYDTSGIYTSNSSGNCVDTLVLTISEFLTNFTASPTLITSPPFNVTFNNTTPNISNYDFTWDFGDGTIGQTNIPSFVHQYMSNGIYDVSLIAEDITNNCGYDTLKIDNLISCSGGSGTSINEKQQLVNIYPNPTNENITISVENFNGNIQTEVYDLIGNRLQTTNETTISLEDYARGIYLLKVAYGDRVEEIKVIKN